ncbi:MAG: TetR/AcrR family transcriptional regulator [Evtepia gabavorous]
MKRDTRRAILDMAKTLFSQQGYNAVSIGEIAGALGISKGNVTYHFKRKEDIMEALLAEAKPTFFQEPPRTMEELDAFLEDMEQARENYAFYFQHHAQLGQLSPRSARQQAIYHSQSALFAQALSILARQGMFRGRIFPGRMPVWRIPFSSPPFTGFPSVRSRGGRRISGPRPGLCCIPC